MSDLKQDFVDFALQREVLRFGEFRTKAGRLSPYFFNTGLFNDGSALRQLGQFYARTLVASGLPFDMLFGPAYKGIPLVASVAIALDELGRSVPFAFNRKEAKDHGEGGTVVGAALAGRVLIVDDVISAGTSVRESIDIIRRHGAAPCGVLIALDRKERGQGEHSAVQEVSLHEGLPVISIIDLDTIITCLGRDPAMAGQLAAVETYRREFGVNY